MTAYNEFHSLIGVSPYQHYIVRTSPLRARGGEGVRGSYVSGEQKGVTFTKNLHVGELNPFLHIHTHAIRMREGGGVLMLMKGKVEERQGSPDGPRRLRRGKYFSRSTLCVRWNDTDEKKQVAENMKFRTMYGVVKYQGY